MLTVGISYLSCVGVSEASVMKVAVSLPTYGIRIYTMRGLYALSVSMVGQCEGLEGGMGKE